MKKLISITVLFFAFGSFFLLDAQSRWMRSFGGILADSPISIQQTKDGGFIVGGHSYSFGGGFWLLKLFPNGEIEWEKSYTGNGFRASVKQTADEGYIVSGTTNLDFCVLKLFPNGEIEWQRTYGGPWEEVAYSVEQTLDGGYIVGGYTSSFGSSDLGIWILKLSSYGDIRWEKKYAFGSKYISSFLSSIKQTRDGGYVIAGQTSALGPWNLWVFKLLPSGEPEWSHTYGGVAGSGVEEVDIVQTTDGGYIVACCSGAGGQGDFWVLKLFADGEVDWQNAYGWQDHPLPGGECGDAPYSIQQTNEGGYIIVGESNYAGGYGSDVRILKINSNGEREWDRKYDFSFGDRAYSVIQAKDGDYLILAVGYNPEQSTDIFVLKISSFGFIDPSCIFLSASNSSVTKTATSAVDFYVQPSDTTAQTILTSISPQITNAQTFLFCQSIDPIISSLNPESGIIGTPVTVSGSNFGTIPGRVTFNGVEASIATWSDIEIKTAVPSGATTGPVIIYASDGRQSNGAYFTVAIAPLNPIISNLSPNSGPVGTEVTISGSNFGLTQGTVTFNGVEASITSWTNTSIQTFVPPTASTGLVVVDRSDGKASNGMLFTIAGITKYQLTIGVTSRGLTNPSIGSYSYDSGIEVAVEAQPDPGYSFDKWTGEVASGKEKENPVKVIMDRNRSIVANFVIPNQNPWASYVYSPSNPKIEKLVYFDASGSYDNDGRLIYYEWDLNGDGEFDEFTILPRTSFYWIFPGTYEVGLRVRDDKGAWSETFRSPITISKSFWGTASHIIASILNWVNPAFWQNHNSFNQLDNWMREFNPESKPLSWLNDTNFKWCEEADIISIFDKEIDSVNAPGLTYEILALNILEEEKLINYICLYPGLDYYSLMKPLVKYAIGTAEGMSTNLLAEAIKQLADSFKISTGIDCILFILKVRGLINTFGEIPGVIENAGLKMFFLYTSDAGGNTEAGWEEAKKYITLAHLSSSEEQKNEILAYTKQYFESLWTKYGGHYPGGQQAPLPQAFREKIRRDVKSLIINGLIKYRSAFVKREIGQNFSPIEIKAFDSQGNTTGIYHGNIVADIPNSLFDEENETVKIFNQPGYCFYEIVGKEDGYYGLELNAIEEGEATTFIARGIPISFSSRHVYKIDWDALSRGEKGVTVKIDSNGDGIFEINLHTGNSFSLLPAEVNIDPNTLYMKSEGKWITCYIELPKGFDPNNIDVGSIRLKREDDIIAAVDISDPIKVGDYDSDSLPDLMVKFDRATVIQYLKNKNLSSGNLTLSVIGQISDKFFAGTDTIKIMNQ